MKINILFLAILIIFTSCSKDISGVYVHNSCCDSQRSDCFTFKFNKDNTFEYKYKQSSLGSNRIYGTYQQKGRKIILKLNNPPVQQIFFETYESDNMDSTTIQAYKIPAISVTMDTVNYKYNIHYSSKPDTIPEEHFRIKINKEGKYTDSLGILKAKPSKGDIITIAEGGLHTLKDTSYTIVSNNIKNINVYYTELPLEPSPKKWLITEYKIKKNRIYPQSFGAKRFLLGNTSFFTKDICEANHLDIQDTLFHYISKSINWKIESKEHLFPSYLLYFDNKGKINKIMFEEVFNSKKERKKYHQKYKQHLNIIKNSLKHYRLDTSQNIYKNDFPIQVSTYYNQETQELELKNVEFNKMALVVVYFNDFHTLYWYYENY